MNADAAHLISNGLVDHVTVQHVEGHRPAWVELSVKQWQMRFKRTAGQRSGSPYAGLQSNRMPWYEQTKSGRQFCCTNISDVEKHARRRTDTRHE